MLTLLCSKLLLHMIFLLQFERFRAISLDHGSNLHFLLHWWLWCLGLLLVQCDSCGHHGHEFVAYFSCSSLLHYGL